MTGQEWKDVRAAISPTFTSGKIKRVGTIRLSIFISEISSVKYVGFITVLGADEGMRGTALL